MSNKLIHPHTNSKSQISNFFPLPSHLPIQKIPTPKILSKIPSNPSLTIPSPYRTRYRKSTVKLSKIHPLSNHFRTIFFTLPILLPSKYIEISHILPMHHLDHKKYKNIKPSHFHFLQNQSKLYLNTNISTERTTNMQENTLKSELNSMISNNHSSEPSMAQKDARDDFDSIKEQLNLQSRSKITTLLQMDCMK